MQRAAPPRPAVEALGTGHQCLAYGRKVLIKKLPISRIGHCQRRQLVAAREPEVVKGGVPARVSPCRHEEHVELAHPSRLHPPGEDSKFGSALNRRRRLEAEGACSAHDLGALRLPLVERRADVRDHFDAEGSHTGEERPCALDHPHVQPLRIDLYEVNGPRGADPSQETLERDKGHLPLLGLRSAP